MIFNVVKLACSLTVAVLHALDFSDVSFSSAHSPVLPLLAQRFYALLPRKVVDAVLIAVQGYWLCSQIHLS